MFSYPPRPPADEMPRVAHVVGSLASLTQGLRTFELKGEALLVVAQKMRMPASNRSPQPPAFSYVASELQHIKELIEGYPTEALNRLVERSEAALAEAQTRVQESQRDLDRSGLFDWLSGRTGRIKGELAECREALEDADLNMRQLSRMSQSLEQVAEMLEKRQLTVALRSLVHIKKACSEDLKLDQPIKRLEALLARP